MGDLVTIEDNTISGFVGAASVGLFISSDDFGGNAGAVNLEATASGNTITGATTGIWVQGAAARTATVTIDGDNEITGSNVGILVEEVSGGNAVVTIDGNDNSIHGNVTGIDVTGGDATITGNHIYDNTTGIRLTTGGTATINSNNFEGGGSPDNGTDILLTATSGGINGGTMTGNTFAGTTYIRNESAQDITALRSPFGTNFYNVAGVATTNDFVIEGRIYHQVDNASSGLVTWVPNTIFVASVAETGSTPTATDNDYTRIKNAVEAASDGSTIQLLGGGVNAFDWTEANAAASWAVGNNGVAGGGDDYSILVPLGLENVTFTAGILGDATIQGPGDLATFNLESFLEFSERHERRVEQPRLDNFQFGDFGFRSQHRHVLRRRGCQPRPIRQHNDYE